VKNFTDHEQKVEALTFAVKPYGIVTFFPAEPDQPTYLVLPDHKEPVRVRGSMKRLVLSLCRRVAEGTKRAQNLQKMMAGGLN